MIDVILFAHLFATPVAFALLGLILLGNILARKGTFCVQFYSPPAMFNCFDQLWMRLSIDAIGFIRGSLVFLTRTASAFLRTFGVSLAITPTSLTAFFAVLLLVSFSILLLFVRMALVVVANATAMTNFTGPTQSILSSSITRKESVNEVKLADIAAFIGDRHVNHSASLSLYHKWSSADGVICRRSGISLADDTLLYRKTAETASVS